MSPYSDDLPHSIMETSHFGLLKTFGIKGELKFLSSILTGNEDVLAMTRGWVDGRWWLMVVTDCRVIMVHRGLIYGLKYLEVPIVKIKSVSYKTGLFFGTIYIDTGAGTVILDTVNKKCAAEVSNILCEVLAESVLSSPSSTKSAALLDQLERLSSLRDKGVLTEAEFMSQKAMFLSQAPTSSTSHSESLPWPRGVPAVDTPSRKPSGPVPTLENHGPQAKEPPANSRISKPSLPKPMVGRPGPSAR
jgi:hypothetical protein